MDHLFSGSTSVLSLPLPLSANSGEGPKPLLKSTSLSRIDELQQYLKQCDDQQYKRRYFKMLSSCPTDVLDDYAKQLKNRAAWLASEESREYKRAKLLNVMGDPLKPVTSADADAFCTKVLEDDFPADDCETPQFDSKAKSRGCSPPCGTSSEHAMTDTGRRQEHQGGAGGFSPQHVSVMDHHLQRVTPVQDILAQQYRHGERCSPRGGRLSPIQAGYKAASF